MLKIGFESLGKVILTQEELNSHKNDGIANLLKM